MIRALPNSNTNGTLATQNTDILDTPGHRTARSRLSFLQRKPTQSHTREPSENQAVLAPLVNGNGTHKKQGRGRGTSEDGSERSPSKENRKSFFGNVASVGSIGRGRGREVSEGSEWVTESDFSATRRSSSEARPKTGKSEKSSGAGGGGLSREGSVGSRVGSVRKRLSRLTLGKKSSKASVLVGSVAEEE
jgi:dedicator of cytokinesis protein 3